MLLRTGQTSHEPAERNARTTGVTKGDIIGTSGILHERLYKRGRDGDNQTLCDGAPQNHTPSRHTSNLENHGDHRSHVERHMTGQVDVLETRGHRQQDVDNHAEEEDKGGFRPILHQDRADNGFVVRHHTLHIECMLEHAAKGIKCAGNDGSACCQHQESHHGSDGALHNVGSLLALHGKTHQRNQSHNNGWLPENIK